MAADYTDTIRQHYEAFWKRRGQLHRFERGPMHQLHPSFRICELPAALPRQRWTYATCGMSAPDDVQPIELHIFSRQPAQELIELLTVVAHYHRTGASLGLGHTVNFGRPWLPGSECDHGVVSLPYLDGPKLEWLEMPEVRIRCLWRVPITKRERDFKAKHGPNALEEQFEAARVNLLEPLRPSVL